MPDDCPGEVFRQCRPRLQGLRRVVHNKRDKIAHELRRSRGQARRNFCDGSGDHVDHLHYPVQQHGQMGRDGLADGGDNPVIRAEDLPRSLVQCLAYTGHQILRGRAPVCREQGIGQRRRHLDGGFGQIGDLADDRGRQGAHDLRSRLHDGRQLPAQGGHELGDQRPGVE